MNKCVKWSMYVMSYLPLYFLILVQHFTDVVVVVKNWVTVDSFSFSKHTNEKMLIIFCVLLISWSLVTFFLLSINNSLRNEKIGEYEDAGEGTLNYLATFIVPMISLDISNLNTLLANLLLFVVLGKLYTMGDLLYLNPVFTIFGYHIIRDKETKEIIFSRESIPTLLEAGQSNLNEIQVSILGYSHMKILKKIIRNE